MADELSNLQNDLIIRAALRDELSGPIKEMRKEVDETRRSVDRLATAGKKGGKDLEDALDKKAKAARRSVGDLHRGLMSLSSGITRQFAAGVMRGVTVLTLLTGTIGGFGLKAAGQIETSQVAIDTLVGSAEKGEQVFRRIQAINLKSPFELGDLTRAGQDLLGSSLGVERSLQVLQSLSDISALTTDPTNNLIALARAMRQVSDTGKLTGQDALQFSNAGVNIYRAIADATGRSVAEVRKLGEEGKIGADLVVQVVANLEGGLQRFAGGAEKANRTLFGQWSNFKDLLNVELAEAAGPLVDQLRDDMPEIVDLVGGALRQVGPPIFGLLGDLANAGSKLLPLVAGPLETVATGIDRLIAAAQPAAGLLAPLTAEIDASLAALVDELVPVMPDLVELFVALVRVLPDFVRLLTSLVPLVQPLARLATTLLGFEPVRQLLAGLLVVLLSYRAVAGVVGGMQSFAGALGMIGRNAQTVAANGTGAATSINRLQSALAIGTGVVASGALIGQRLDPKHHASLGEDLALIGTTAATGAAIGSIIPIIGTGFGGLAGAGIGAGISLADRFFGDPQITPGMASAHHAANAVAGGSGRRVTSGLRTYGLRDSRSGHLAGTAIDVAGSGLASYAHAIRSAGGAAIEHNAGSGRHVHAEFGDPPTLPRSFPWSDGGPTRSGGRTGPLVVIERLYTNGQVDLELAMERAIRKVERSDRNRARTPGMVR